MKQILPVLGIIIVMMAGCATQSGRTSQRPIDLPAIIKYPETAQVKTEVEKEKTVQEKTKKERLAQQPRITNLWEDADLRAVLQDFSAQTGVNVIYDDDTIEGRVTLEIKDMPFEKALKMVLSPGGYTFRKIEDYYLVGPTAPGTPTALELFQTETIVTNRPAKEIAQLLSKDLSPFVRTTEDGHLLSITAPAEVIERIKKDLSLIDSPRDQIVIEALVCETKWSKGKSTGMDWSQILDLSAQGTLTLERGSKRAAIGIFKGNFASSIQAMAQKGDLDIRANPRIVTMDGEQAQIEVTRDNYIYLYETFRPGEIPYYYYNRYEAKPIKSGVILKVTPRISREGDIILTLEPEVSDIDRSANENELPVVNRRGAKTKVRVKSGETVVIGGLRQQLEREVEIKLPILGDIPILKFFFRRTKTEKSDTEIVIFVTPRILSSSEKS